MLLEGVMQPQHRYCPVPDVHMQDPRNESEDEFQRRIIEEYHDPELVQSVAQKLKAKALSPRVPPLRLPTPPAAQTVRLSESSSSTAWNRAGFTQTREDEPPMPRRTRLP